MNFLTLGEEFSESSFGVESDNFFCHLDWLFMYVLSNFWTVVGLRFELIEFFKVMMDGHDPKRVKCPNIDLKTCREFNFTHRFGGYRLTFYQRITLNYLECDWSLKTIKKSYISYNWMLVVRFKLNYFIFLLQYQSF